MHDKKKAELIQTLMKANPDATSELVRLYAEEKELDLKTISDLRMAYAKAVLPKGNITPKLPRTYKPGRQGGDPDTN